MPGMSSTTPLQSLSMSSQISNPPFVGMQLPLPPVLVPVVNAPVDPPALNEPVESLPPLDTPVPSEFPSPQSLKQNASVSQPVSPRRSALVATLARKR